MNFFQQNLEALNEGLGGDHESSGANLERRLSAGAQRFERLQARGCDYLLDAGHVIDCTEAGYWKKSFAKRHADLKHPKILVLFGPRMGFELHAIIEREPSIEFILLMDFSSDLIRETLDSVDLTAWAKMGRLALEVVENSDRAHNVFYQWLRNPDRAFVMDTAWILVHPQVLKTEALFSEKLTDEWIAATKQIRRHFGSRDDSLLGFHQIIENQKIIESSPGIISLKDQFKNWPAIVVSTGPSLNRSIEDLKKVQHKALLIAADASLPVLKKAGLEPHFVATLERDHVSKRFFENDSFAAHLIAYAFVPHANIEAFQGSRWIAYRDYGYLHYLDRVAPRGIVASASSVSHLCMNLALLMGCREIVLVGQDLAYDAQTFQSHASGVSFEDWAQPSTLEKMKERIQEEGLGDLIFLPGNKGGEVPSHSVYFSFLKEFAWQAARSPVPVTNATEGGAQIPGIPWKSLTDISRDWHSENDFFRAVNNLHETAPREGSLGELRNFIPFFKELSDKLKEIIQLSQPLLTSSGIPEDKVSAIVQALRLAQRELTKDPRVMAFIIQNAGMDLLNIENTMARIEAEGKTREALLSQIDAWNTWVLSVSEAIQKDLGLLTPRP